MTWTLLEIGCAECGDWPLVVPRGTYATAREAASVVERQQWKAHPQGGYISQSGSGAYWIAPTSALQQVGAIDGTEYDAPREAIEIP